jgi:predicted nucleic acid-binding protein
MVLADSSVWIEFLNNTRNPKGEILERLLYQEIIYTGDLIIVEVLQGIRNQNEFVRAKSMFDLLPCVQMLNKELAIKSASNYRWLIKKGITIRKTIDIIIATFCIENGFTLLHNDKDFLPIEKHLGLKTIDK